MIGAFFDMDRTLITCNSGMEWIRFLRRRGEISAWKTIKALSWVARYKLSLLDLEAITREAISDLTGDDEAEMIAKVGLFFDRQVRDAVAPRAHQAIDYHRQAGHLLAILSSSTPYVTERLAAHLGIEHVLCTRLHVQDGRFVGTHEKPACAGPGKVHWAERFACERGIDLDASWFYTDSYTDLPMLERVGVKRVINPDARLRRHARHQGWAVEEW